MIKTPTRMAVLLLLGLVSFQEYTQAMEIDSVTNGLEKSKSKKV